jgi:PIN domain nuclease of toxin-antitoxin system
MSSLLLDTHVLLWALTDDDRLSAPARSAITDGTNQVFVSAVCAWEIIIKKALGKLRAPDDLPVQLAAKRITELPVTIVHALAIGGLPRHHADPFDRMLIAQAQVEELVLVTRDEQILRYDVAVLVA